MNYHTVCLLRTDSLFTKASVNLMQVKDDSKKSNLRESNHSSFGQIEIPIMSTQDRQSESVIWLSKCIIINSISIPLVAVSVEDFDSY